MTDQSPIGEFEFLAARTRRTGNAAVLNQPRCHAAEKLAIHLRRSETYSANSQIANKTAI
jgi:hypothetical protein|tara:strand:- start:936 stop:1115 length:180 start_codon:yes stop_codon:yes gene_type:complete